MEIRIVLVKYALAKYVLAKAAHAADIDNNRCGIGVIVRTSMPMKQYVLE